jgi:hypothetical protein
VLARAGAVHGERPLHEPLQEHLDGGDLGGIVRVDQRLDVKVAVANVADDGSDQPHLLDVALRLGDALGEARDRHAHVRRDRLRPGTQDARSPIGIMAGLP